MPKVQKDTVGSRMSERRKYKKTKLRKSRKNILKKGGDPPKTINEDYKATIELFTSIFPSFETTLDRLKTICGFEYLKFLIGSLIGFLETFANAKGYSNMRNEEQIELILKPALEDFIASIKNPRTTSITAWTIGSIVRNAKLDVNEIINKEIIVEEDTTSKKSKKTRKNVLLSKVLDNQLIPELITHLKVYNEGIYYSGNPIPEYVFPKSTLESQKGLGTEDDRNRSPQERLGTEDDGNRLTPESQEEVKGGKKKSKTTNKLYRGSGTMYLRRKTKNNRCR